jgi:hypothetical protein
MGPIRRNGGSINRNGGRLNETGGRLIETGPINRNGIDSSKGDFTCKFEDHGSGARRARLSDVLDLAGLDAVTKVHSWMREAWGQCYDFYNIFTEKIGDPKEMLPD